MTRLQTESRMMKNYKLPNIKGGLIYLWQQFKQYLENSSIHGFKYLVEANTHWTEKLFWIMACGVSFWACGIMVIKTIQFATAQDVSITMDTTYLDWEMRMPALHFCFSGSRRAFPGRSSIEQNYSKLILDYGTLGEDRQLRLNLTDELVEEIRTLVQPTSADLLGICKFNDEKFDCNKAFFPLSSNIGQCLSFNSYQAGESRPPLPKFIMNHRKQRAKLSLIMNETQYLTGARKTWLQTYLVNGYDYPTRTTNKEKNLHFKWEKKLAVIDVVAIPGHIDDEVQAMEISMRKCKLPTESTENLIMKYYNYDGCLMETQMRNMYKLLGCVSHIFPKSKTMRICNATELQQAKKLGPIIKNISMADCLPDCVGEVYEFSSNLYDHPDLPDWSVLQIDINMLPGPSVRYYMFPTRSVLQTIISVGSVVGLFMGASLLSIVEIIYWLLLRKTE